MLDDDAIVERAIAKFGSVLDLNSNPQALLDIVHAARLQDHDPDGGLPPGGTPPPPGPTSSQGSEATLDDLMVEVFKLSRRLTDTTKEIALLRERLG